MSKEYLINTGVYTINFDATWLKSDDIECPILEYKLLNAGVE